MLRYIKIQIVTVCCLFLILTTHGQSPSTTVGGKIIDENSEQPIPYATVVLKEVDTNDIITGTITSQEGDFTLKTQSNNFYIEVSFIGYESLLITSYEITNEEVNLGKVALKTNRKVLNEIVVESNKSTTEFKIDKRVFNVGSDLSSTGVGALELLNNVPSVNVNIEGEISLRGSTGVQILIDGKPSVTSDDPANALGTITGDMIERVEVITNPSAKYDAEGTSGILNIVLKKEEKKGLNGSISINTGIPDNHSVGLSLNRRTEKFNLFAQLGTGYRSVPRFSKNDNRNLMTNRVVSNEGEDFRNETFYNIVLGTDYHINKLNVLTLSGNFAYEKEDLPSAYLFTIRDNLDSVVSKYERIGTTTAVNPKWRYELQYKKEFKDDKEHVLQFSALGHFFGKELSSLFENRVVIGESSFLDQLTATDYKQADYTFKLDYTDPISETVIIEAGAQYVINDIGNNFVVQDEQDDFFVVNERLTNDFQYDQQVFGIYTTLAYESDSWGVKVGSRLEHTALTTLLTNTGEGSDQRYTNLFPSAHASYKISKELSLQGGYSKRIYRPRLWDLNPFFNIKDNFNIRTGNPNLLPQFTDVYELTGIYTKGKVSLNTGVYHRFTSEVIERVSSFEDNVNITSPENIGNNSTTGFEINIDFDPADWLNLTGDVNYNYFNREGQFGEQTFDFNADRGSAKLSARIKLPAKIDFEVTGNYRSGYKTVQRTFDPMLFMNLGLRKKMLDGKVIWNVGVRDLFNSRIFASQTIQPNFTLNTRSNRGRFVTIGFSYGFGKGEAMTYAGGRRH